MPAPLGPILVVGVQLLMKAIALLATIVGAIIPSLIGLGALALKKATMIPRYIEALRAIMKADPEKSIPCVTLLVMITAVVPALTFSIMPLMSVPILGVIPAAFALAISFIIVMYGYEFVISQTSQDVLVGKYSDVIKDWEKSYEQAKGIIGDKKWSTIGKCIEKLIKENEKTIYDFANKSGDQINNVCEKIVESITPSLNQYQLIIGDERLANFDANELKIIQESFQPWEKVGLSAGAGIAAGMGTSAVAGSVFVEATVMSSVLGFMGVGSSGIALSSGAFAAATIALPIAAGIGAGALCLYGFKKVEQKKMSKFFADVFIASISMINADKVVDDRELAFVRDLANNDKLLEGDKDRVTTALKNPAAIDLAYINKNELMNETNDKKQAVKCRLLVTIAMAIAEADGEVVQAEIDHCKRLARAYEVDPRFIDSVREVTQYMLPQTVQA